METYIDIYKEVLKGNTVIITTCYGNTRTYFKDEEGKVRQRFNNCQDNLFNPTNARIETVGLRSICIVDKLIS